LSKKKGKEKERTKAKAKKRERERERERGVFRTDARATKRNGTLIWIALLF
jgi:hypothetical protein